MTQMMLDIFLENMSNIIEENDIPREYVVFAIGVFLDEYETKSLMLATERLIRDLSDYRKMTKPYFELTLEEISELSNDEKAQAQAWVQMGLIHSLMMETIVDLTRSLAND